MSEWNEKPLSDLAILYNDSWKVGDEKCPYIALEHIEESKLRLNGTGNFDIATSNKYRFNEKNFLFGKLRPYFRKVVRPQFSGICSTDIWVVGARGETDLIFLFYLFANQKFVDLAYSGSSGTRMPRADWKFMKDTVWLIPLDIEEQRAIASVFSSFDDKIDLLHRQNKTLEAMAEALFRQWFVEAAEEGWEEGVLYDVISVKGGTTPSTKKSEYWDGDIYWTSPRDLSNHTSVFIFDTKRKITERGLVKIGSGLLPIGTVLLSSRAPIGYLAITEIPLAINQGYIAIVCDKVVSNYFIYLWCKVNMEEIQNLGNGSVFQEIAKSVFKEISITIPPPPLLDDFDKTVNPVFSKIKKNQQQIRTLEKLRDTLLPKLMSGEVRIEY
jgi:type I restriction enzyme S subunit